MPIIYYQHYFKTESKIKVEKNILIANNANKANIFRIKNTVSKIVANFFLFLTCYSFVSKEMPLSYQLYKIC